MKHLMLPIKDLTTLYNSANELNVKHGMGNAAIDLRFDANKGRFKYGNENFITEVNEPFNFNPVGFRAFWGRPFEQYKTPEVWIEIYGICAAKCTFRLLLRGSSATELNKFAYFFDIRPTETFLKLTPVMRFSKEHSKQYYILSPDFEAVKKGDEETMKALKSMLYIYSDQLIHVGFDGKPFVTIIAENYCGEDYIDQKAFQYFETTAEKPSMLAIVAPQLVKVDENLMELPSNNKGLKRAA